MIFGKLATLKQPRHNSVWNRKIKIVLTCCYRKKYLDDFNIQLIQHNIQVNQKCQMSLSSMPRTAIVLTSVAKLPNAGI